MRNLKRVLSLAMASVMLLGMMVIGAGAADKTAADLTDIDKVTNKEAVTLLVDLGIIEGKPDGSYAPAETVNRATMAKLITFIMMGDVDQNTFKGTRTDLTDVDGHWAEGYVKYCYSNGIIVGDGAGHFMPDEPVTTVTAAKMLLVALGYDAKDRGYENNANWAINIMKDAQSTFEGVGGTKIRSLTKGLSVKATDPLSRDNAAQMIFNTLFVRTLTPKYAFDMGVRYISEYVDGSSMAITTYSNLKRDTAVLDGIDGNGNVTTTSSVFKSIAFSNKVAGDVANMGKVVAYYVRDNSPVTLVSTAVVEDKENVAVTVPGNLVVDSTDSKDVSKWLKANGLELGASSVTQVINYQTSTNAITVNDLANIGNYTQAYVIDTDGDKVIDTLVKTTKTVSEVTGAVKTKTDSDGNVTVNVPGVTAGYVKATGYEDLKKGDIVMHITYPTTDGTTYITKAEMLTGKITGNKGTGTVYFDGTAYTVSNVTVTPTKAAFRGQTAVTMQGIDNTGKKDANLFLDENGNALFAKLVDGSSSYNVAVVLGYDKSTSSVKDTVIATARLLLADGTITTVEVSETTGAALNSSMTTALNNTNKVLNANYIPVAYSIDADGNYELTVLTPVAQELSDSDYVIAELTDDSIAPNKAIFTAGAFGNSDTLFSVAQYNATSGKFTGVGNYEGIAKAPKYTAGGSNGAYGVVISVDDVAALVFIVDGSELDNSTTKNYIYIPNGVTGVYTSADKTYTYEGAYLNGEKTTVVTKNLSLTTKALLQASLNDDGIVTSAVAVSTLGNAYATGIGVKQAGKVVTIDTQSGGAPAAYTLDKDGKVFEISADQKTITEISLDGITADKTDVVTVLGASDMDSTLVAKYIYIQKVDSNVATLEVQVEVGTGDETADTFSAGGDGSTVALAKTETLNVVSGSATAHNITVTATGADQAIVSVVSNSLPSATAAAGTASGNIVYKVTAEDGSFLYYNLTVVITAA